MFCLRNVNSHDSVYSDGKTLFSEAIGVLKNMANNKSHGRNVFTADYLKVSWKN